MKIFTQQYVCTWFIYKKNLICRLTRNGESPLPPNPCWHCLCNESMKPLLALLCVWMDRTLYGIGFERTWKNRSVDTPRLKLFFLRFYFAIRDMFLIVARYIIILDKAQKHDLVQGHLLSSNTMASLHSRILPSSS